MSSNRKGKNKTSPTKLITKGLSERQDWSDVQRRLSQLKEYKLEVESRANSRED